MKLKEREEMRKGETVIMVKERVREKDGERRITRELLACRVMSQQR